MIRSQPEEKFQEAKQAVDLTQAPLIVSVGRGIKSKDNIALAEKLAEVLGADLAFIGKAKLPVRKSREGYLETIPDLVVEIRSKNDTRAELEQKAGEYLRAGVGIVLVVDPEAKTIAEHRAGAEPRVSIASDTLALVELIPDFRLNLAECFSESLD